MDIHESLHRILEHKQSLTDLFYKRFLEDAQVERHFAGVDLHHQSVLLTMALMVIERHYTCSYPATHQYLQHLGTKHSVRGIPQALYAKFRDDLLATLERFHRQEWEPALEAQWRAAIEGATDAMLEGYREPVYV
jgi:hemoglobin-like flavoprotein